MPTVISHAAPALAMGLALGDQYIPPRLLALGTALAIAPDLDSIGFFMGVPYESLWGHRGISHSLAAALAIGFMGFLTAPLLKSQRLIAALFLLLAWTSHIALDAATSGGLGPLALWPLDDSRHFLPYRPIRVAPMHPAAMLSGRGMAVILSELKWVWFPCFCGAALILPVRKILTKRKKPSAPRTVSFPRGR